jgi:hypothetical protein
VYFLVLNNGEQNVIGSWQLIVWNSPDSSATFDNFCAAINAPVSNVSTQAVDSPFGAPERMVEIEPGFSLDVSVLNWGKYIKNTTVSRCSTTVEEVINPVFLEFKRLLTLIYECSVSGHMTTANFKILDWTKPGGCGCSRSARNGGFSLCALRFLFIKIY